MDTCFRTTIMFSKINFNKLFVDLVLCLCRMTVVFLEFVNKENTNMVYERKFQEVLDRASLRQQFHHTPYKVIWSYNFFELVLQLPRINQENTYYTFF